ncbi:hypothetical protein [Candidatus Albibeggiatoa sp. nov. NOAA]|uniref:hypothetical protein n=1 Tax=Candidatus Albibeggiatoa sp. nov. NOAA TaxID=3162724 RepID=UPI0033037FC9|nr:hypothetical protein [Thiotrichaceae bacterium]
MQRSIWFLILFLCSPFAMAALDLQGTWKATSYQIIGYTPLSDAEAKAWVGNTVRFANQVSTLRTARGAQSCRSVSYQPRVEDAEGYFLIGYGVKPQQLGITQSQITVISTSCRQNSWMGPYREFVQISEQQMLTDWEGVLVFFNKQPEGIGALASGSQPLILSPQSLGSITPETPYQYQTLAQAFSGYQISAKRGYMEVMRKGDTKFKVYPNLHTGKVAKILIFDDTVTAPGGVKLGMSYPQIFNQDGQIVDCEKSFWRGKSTCYYPSMRMIEYIFNTSRPTRGGKLTEIHWTADITLVSQ